MSNFIQKCINGDALLLDIDNYIEVWHKSDSNVPIYSFLGMSKEEYMLYLENESNLNLILSSHKNSNDNISILENELEVV